MTEAPAPHPRAPRRSLRRLALWAAACTVTFAVLFAFAFSRAHRQPAWWHQSVADTTPQQAESFEHALLAQLTRVRDSSDSWSAALSEADLNAWLTHRLAAWITNRGLTSPLPAGAAVCVSPQANRLLIGVRTNDAFLWSAVRPQMRDGRLYLEPLEAGVGDLTLPLWAFRAHVPASLNNWLAAGLPTTVPIDRARVAHLQEVTSQPGQVVVTVRTFARP